MAEFKTVTLSKEAANEFMGGISGATRKRSRSKKIKGGDQLPVGATPTIIKVDTTAPVIPATPIPAAPTLPTLVPKASSAVSSTVPSAVPSSVPSAFTSSSAITGGASDIKPVRVELKRKVETKKVQLQPKKSLEHVKSLKKMGTKKHRKVSLGISTMHRRLTRAKKTQSRIKQIPIDKLKAQLISKKLIKPTSKAPESVLRQIAEDSQLMADKAL